MGAFLARLVTTFPSVAREFVNQVWGIIKKSMQNQVGAAMIGTVFATTFSDTLQSLWATLYDRYQRLMYVHFRIKGEDAASLLRWVAAQPGAREANTFNVTKDIAAQLRISAQQRPHEQGGASAAVTGYEFEPALDRDTNLRLIVNGSVIWFRSGESNDSPRRRPGMRGPAPRSYHERGAPPRGASGGGGGGRGASNAATSAVAGFDGLNAAQQGVLENDEAEIASTCVRVTFLTTPWKSSTNTLTLRASLGKMIMEGKAMRLEDCSRYTTYEVPVDSYACSFLERWLRAQQMMVDRGAGVGGVRQIVDGDGMTEEAPASGEVKNASGDSSGEQVEQRELGERDRDIPTFLMRSRDQKELHLTFQGVPLWVTATREVGYTIRTKAKEGFVEALLLEGHRLVKLDLPPYTTFHFTFNSPEVRMGHRCSVLLILPLVVNV